MQPNPSADTSSLPSLRFLIRISFPMFSSVLNLGSNLRSAVTRILFQTSQSRGLVHHLHLFFIHPATVHFNFRNSVLNLTEICTRQLNVHRTDVLVQVIDVAGAGNRNNDWLLHEQPSQ